MLRQTFRHEQLDYKLSVLICSLQTRLDSLKELLTELNRQSLGSKVEILWLGDNKSMTVGEKRNLLLFISRGEYVCFVDDDDMISEDYIAQILKGIETHPDVFSFNVMKHTTGKDGAITDQLMIHRKQHGKNHTRAGVMKMIPNHLNAIRRDIAIREAFPLCNLAEDHKWADKILIHLNNEVCTDAVLYHYNDNKGKSETRKR